MQIQSNVIRLSPTITNRILDTRRRLTIMLWEYDLRLQDARKALGLEVAGSDPVTFMLHQRTKVFMPEDAPLVEEVMNLVKRNPIEVLRSVEGFTSEAATLH